MRFKTPKLRPDAPVSTDRIPIPLEASAQRSTRITQIDHPATKYPLEHSVSTTDPHQQAEEYRDAVRALVADFAIAGGFDEDNLEMLSFHIASWLEEWNARTHQVANRRLETAETLVSQVLQNLKEVTRDLALHQEHRAEVIATRTELLTTQFGFAARMIVDPAVVRADAEKTTSADQGAFTDGAGVSVVRSLRAAREARRTSRLDTDVTDGTVEPLRSLPLPPLESRTL